LGRRGRCTPSKALSKGFLLINPRSGDRRPAATELLREAQRRGVGAHILREDDDPGDLARQAAGSGAGTLGIAGGDGSLGAVAAVALERELPFACVPFGTRNHFARDLGLDVTDPIAALAAFEGSEQRVDVGAVADRIFLNNVSLGVYASFVHDPKQKTRNRLVAFLRMTLAALGKSREPLDVAFEIEGRREHHAALVVLVGNNDYRIESLADLGGRARLDEGLLHVWVIEAVSRRALVGLLFRAATGGLGKADGLVEWPAPGLSVDLPHQRIHAAIDGEPAVLESPLEFEVRPQALRVLIPPAAAGGES
jgi:diacylglycerol kinase family enzyme